MRGLLRRSAVVSVPSEAYFLQIANEPRVGKMRRGIALVILLLPLRGCEVPPSPNYGYSAPGYPAPGYPPSDYPPPGYPPPDYPQPGYVPDAYGDAVYS